MEPDGPVGTWAGAEGDSSGDAVQARPTCSVLWYNSPTADTEGIDMEGRACSLTCWQPSFSSHSPAASRRTATTACHLTTSGSPVGVHIRLLCPHHPTCKQLSPAWCVAHTPPHQLTFPFAAQFALPQRPLLLLPPPLLLPPVRQPHTRPHGHLGELHVSARRLPG